MAKAAEGLLTGEDEAAEIVNPERASPIVVICEHAGRCIPKRLGTLGLPESELSRHIAWDIGAAGTARMLARLLDAPLVLQRYSRLVYDCNRPPEEPSAMPILSETTRIPGNTGLGPEQRLERIEAIYRPFHAAVSHVLDRRAAQGRATSLATIHSFTPVYKGRQRSLDLGLLHDHDARLADRLLQAFPGFDVRRNEPYGPKDGVCHTLHLHGEARGIPHVMIEIRNDLIAEERGRSQWAHRLSVALGRAVAG